MVYKNGNPVQANMLILLDAYLDLKEDDLVILKKKNGRVWHDLKKYPIITITEPDGFGAEYMEIIV